MNLICMCICGISSWVLTQYRFFQDKFLYHESNLFQWLNEKIKFTCALSGFRHVAKMCFVGLLDASNCLTNPRPSPRLLPVIKIEFILLFVHFDLISKILISGYVLFHSIELFRVIPLEVILSRYKDCLSNFNTHATTVYAAYNLYVRSREKKTQPIDLYVFEA